LGGGKGDGEGEREEGSTPVESERPEITIIIHYVHEEVTLREVDTIPKTGLNYRVQQDS
jgi:hypothetical protein